MFNNIFLTFCLPAMLLKMKKEKRIYSFFCDDLKMMEVMSPKTKAAVIPAEEAVSPPDKIPIAPRSSTASLTPRPMLAPKPINGRDTPAPNTFSAGS